MKISKSMFDNAYYQIPDELRPLSQKAWQLRQVPYSTNPGTSTCVGLGRNIPLNLELDESRNRGIERGQRDSGLLRSLRTIV